MDAIRKSWRTLGPDERGATAIEYGLIVSLIAIAAIGGMSKLGGGSLGMWTNISQQVQDATN
ncbi:MAG TPA: Flp family type IVb pilin [Sphingomicrobium sp.]